MAVRWDPPDCWHLHPRRPLTLLEAGTPAGRPRALAVDCWGWVWDNDPARQPSATWRKVVAELHALLPRVTNV